jgi:TRAP-type C4-dicarboxylate transport system permease large subunit
MKTTIRLLSMMVALAASASGVGFLLAGLWPGMLLSLAWAVLWVIGLRRYVQDTDPEASPKAGIGSGLLLGYTLLVMGGIWTGVWPGWLLLGTCAALASWDLEFFIHRLRDVLDEGEREEMRRIHLQRLGFALFAGLVLAGAALVFHYQLTFGLAVVVAFLAIAALARFIAFFRQAIH